MLRDGHDVTLIATGSEVAACLGAAEVLAGDEIDARVVSMPCWELFEQQSDEYRQHVLGQAPRVSVEAASVFGWEQVVGDDGLRIGIDRFGASAPAEVLANQFGFTPDAIAETVRRYLSS